jgi:DNA-binding IclR family transcriptional regulator
MPRYPSQPPSNTSAAVGGVLAADRALLLLGAFREGDTALTLGELAARTHLVKSTALRLLASLIHFGWIRRDASGRYRLGSEVARLAAVHQAGLDVAELVMPVLSDLMARTRESAAFHVRRGDERICLCRVDSPQALRDHGRVGEVLPLDRGAGGRVLLAFSGARGALYDRIRRAGVAALQGDRIADLAGIAAPVLGAGDELVGALTLILPTHRYRVQYIPEVQGAARALTLQLGGKPPK